MTELNRVSATVRVDRRGFRYGSFRFGNTDDIMADEAKITTNLDVAAALLPVLAGGACPLARKSDSKALSSSNGPANRPEVEQAGEDSLHGSSESSSGLSKAAELAAAIANGDAGAEEEMALLYEPGMRRILRTRTDRPEDVDDLVNDVWALALPKLRNGELRDLAALPAWLNAFARRVASNYLKKFARKASKSNDYRIDRLVAPGDCPYAQLEWEQAYRIACTILDELPVERDRAILVRFLIAEEDKEAICKDLELSTIAFSKVLHRARTRFKELARPFVLPLTD